MSLTQNQRIQAQVNAIKDLRAKQLKDSQTKPDWITDKEWEANPNVYHWEQSRKAMQFHEQSKNPLTREQIEEQMRKRAISLGENPKV